MLNENFLYIISGTLYIYIYIYIYINNSLQNILQKNKNNFKNI